MFFQKHDACSSKGTTPFSGIESLVKCPLLPRVQNIRFLRRRCPFSPSHGQGFKPRNSASFQLPNKNLEVPSMSPSKLPFTTVRNPQPPKGKSKFRPVSPEKCRRPPFGCPVKPQQQKEGPSKKWGTWIAKSLFFLPGQKLSQWLVEKAASTGDPGTLEKRHSQTWASFLFSLEKRNSPGPR